MPLHRRSTCRSDSLSQVIEIPGDVSECRGFIAGNLLVVTMTSFAAGTKTNKLTKLLKSPRRVRRYTVHQLAPADGTYAYMEAHQDGTVNVRTNTDGSVYGTLVAALE